MDEGSIRLLANYGPFNGKYKSAILNAFKKVYNEQEKPKTQ